MPTHSKASIIPMCFSAAPIDTALRALKRGMAKRADPGACGPRMASSAAASRAPSKAAKVPASGTISTIDALSPA